MQQASLVGVKLASLVGVDLALQVGVNLALLPPFCSAQRKSRRFLNCLEAPVRSTRLSGWLAFGFQTIFHFADELLEQFGIYRMYPITMLRMLDSLSSAVQWYIYYSVVKLVLRILCTHCDI